jgi:hypothetical protein
MLPKFNKIEIDGQVFVRAENIKTRSAGAALFHEDGRTDVATRTDACRNCFASAPKNDMNEIRHKEKQRREFSLRHTQSTARFHQKTTCTHSRTVLPANLPPGRNTHSNTVI